MTLFVHNTKHKKKSGIRLFIYGIIIIVIVSIFIPKLLISKASKILETFIKGNVADTFPPSQVFVANNYLLTARYFPGYDQKGIDGQKIILDYYFPLFKSDYDQLKYACIDNAVTQYIKQGIEKDSARILALESGWKQYPDTAALSLFRQHWDIYHKSFIKSLPDYYRFVDSKHL